MQKNRSKEKGHALLIIVVVVLALAVIGLLGYVFWQKTMGSTVKTAATKATTTTSSTSSTQPTLSKTASDQTFQTGLTISYPSTWTVSHTTIGTINDPSDGSVDDITALTSPDSKTVVTMDIAARGQLSQGGCTNSSDVVGNLVSDSISGSLGIQFVAFSIADQSQQSVDSTSAMYGVADIDQSDAAKFADGQAICGPEAIPAFDVSSPLTIPDNGGSTVSAKITATIDGESSGETVGSLKTYFASSDFTTLKSIMESVKTT